MLRKLMGKGSSGAGLRRKDKAIIHQSVPDEVLYPEKSDDPNPVDTSWMETVPSKEASQTEPKEEAMGETASQVTSPAPVVSNKPKPITRPGAPLRSSGRVTSSIPAQSSDDPMPTGLFDRAANAPAAARAPRPAGWLVIVEGPGEGEWYVLENGVSAIGAAEGQTVALPFENSGVNDERHAAIAFDETSGRFYIDAIEFRLNGLAKSGMAQIRDGDVIALGNISLKLVALTGPNFRWVL